MNTTVWSKRLLHFALCLFFFGIPLLSLREMFSSVLDVRTEMAREEAQESLNHRLWKITQGIQPRVQAEHLARTFRQEINRQTLALPFLQEILDRMRKKTGISFQVFFFDRSGAGCFSGLNPPEEHEMFAALWQALAGKIDWELCPQRTSMENYLGLQFQPAELQSHPNTPVAVLGKRGRGFLFWYPSHPLATESLERYTFFLSVQDLPPASQLLRRPGTLKGDPDLVLVLERGGQPPEFTFDTGNRPQAEQAYRTFLAPTGTPRDPSWIWASFRFEDIRMVAGQQWEPGNLLLIGRLADQAFLFGGILVILFGTIGLELLPLVFFPIRLKIAGLFLYLTLVAASGLAAQGFRHMNERRAVLLAEGFKGGLEMLGRLDADFDEERLRILDEFRMVKAEVERNQGKIALDALSRKYTLNWLDVRALDNSVLYVNLPKEDTDVTTMVAGYLARKTIEQFLQERLGGRKPFDSQPSDAFIQGLIDSPVTGGSRLFNRPDELHSVQFGHLDLFWFWSFFPRPDRPLATLMSNRPVYICLQEYLLRRLKMRFSHEQGAFRLLAFSAGSGDSFVGETPVAEELRDVVERLRLSREPVTGILTLPDGRFLVAGMPGKLLKDKILVCLYPYGEINRRILPLADDLKILLLASLLVALLLGGLLARMFVVPIAELSRGVKALHERDPGIRIPDLGGDEFGELGRTFNQTIEEIGELLLAKTVQSRLIPTSLPAVPGVEIDLLNIMASDLGGDYCDCQVLPDGRVLLIIGDVTGHGVSSSLVMAMAKAAVFAHIREGIRLGPMLEELDQLLFRSLKKKKFMTCFAALIDPHTGTGVCTNAGHPYPLIIAPDGKAHTLNLTRLPLGMSKKAVPCQELPFQLAPGSLMILYTDGLIEMLDPSGEQWGYDRLESFLRDLRDKPLAAIKQAIVEEARRFSQTDILDDDLTFLLLRKSPGAEENRVSPCHHCHLVLP
jgi:hypothetical protein